MQHDYIHLFVACLHSLHERHSSNTKSLKKTPTCCYIEIWILQQKWPSRIEFEPTWEVSQAYSISLKMDPHESKVIQLKSRQITHFSKLDWSTIRKVLLLIMYIYIYYIYIYVLYIYNLTDLTLPFCWGFPNHRAPYGVSSWEVAVTVLSPAGDPNDAPEMASRQVGLLSHEIKGCFRDWKSHLWFVQLD